MPKFEVHPQGLQEFRKHAIHLTGSSLGVLVFALLFSWTSLYFKWLDGHYISLFILLIGQFVILFLWSLKMDIRHRLVDLYPDEKLPHGLFATLTYFIIPLGVFSYGYLLWKEKTPKQPIPWFFKKYKTLVSASVACQTLLFLLAIGHSSPGPLYYASSPTVQFFQKMTEDWNFSKKEGERLKSLSKTGHLPRFSEKAFKYSMSASTFAHMHETYFNEYHQYKVSNRIPASEKERLNVDAFLHSMDLIANWKTDYWWVAKRNPFVVVLPASILEMSVIGVLYADGENVAKMKIMSEYDRISLELLELYPHLEETKTFRSKLVGSEAYAEYLMAKDSFFLNKLSQL